MRLRAVNGAQESLQLVGFDVDVVVRPDEPLELVDVVLVHVVEHHEGLLLRGVAVVHILQGDQRDAVGDGALRAEEGHPSGHLLAPGVVDGLSPALQEAAGGHDAHEDQVALRVADGVGGPQPDDVQGILLATGTQPASLHDLQGSVVLEDGADAEADGDAEAGEDEGASLGHGMLHH